MDIKTCTEKEKKQTEQINIQQTSTRQHPTLFNSLLDYKNKMILNNISKSLQYFSKFNLISHISKKLSLQTHIHLQIM